MGRDYDGDICGRFTAGRDSDDAENFGKEYKEKILYEPCHCEYEDGVPFCTRCYRTEEEQKTAIQDFYDCERDAVKTFEKDIAYIYYEFTKKDLRKVEQVLLVLQQFIPGIVRDRTSFVGDKFEIQVNNLYPGLMFEYDNKIYTRWCFGKQIALCLKKHGRCNFKAEL